MKGSRFAYVVVAVCCWALPLAALRSAEGQRDPLSGRDRTAEVNGIRLHYRDIGSGPALLLLHGFTGSSDMWSPVVPLFAQDHRLILVDLPGHGRSTAHQGPYTYRQVALDLFALLDGLGVQRFKGIGFSAGGNVLIHMATQQPDRVEAMASVAGGHRLVSSVRQLLRDAPAFETELQAVRDYWLRIHPGGEPQVRALLAHLRSLADNYDDLSFTPERLSQIKARTLLIWGDRDELYPMEVALEMYRAIPQAALWVVPFQGHAPLWPEWGGSNDAARIFPSIIRAFLKKENAK